MNSTQTSPPTVRWSAAALLGATLIGLSLAGAQAKPPTKAIRSKPADAPRAAARPADPPPAKAKPQLTGEQLYQINCNRCHSERYPTEFTAAQWQTIMLEMRVRANLPAKQARKILEYLQEDSGN